MVITAMKESDEHKKTIVEYFVSRSVRGMPHQAHNVNDIFRRLSRRDNREMQQAFGELVEDKIIIVDMSDTGEFYLLNFIEKPSEIREVLRKEPFIERAKTVKPEKKFFEGWVNVFERATERAWPNRGIYYYCTKKDNPDFWKVVIRTKPNVMPTTINLGDLKDPESRIAKMWKVILEVWITNNREPIWKKRAEDANQTVFGNNRQPATCGFQIFEYMGWLKEKRKKGNTIYYDIIDDQSYSNFLRERNVD